MTKKQAVLKEAPYKSRNWADQPVIADSLFREYDLRSAVRPLSKGGLPIKAALNEDGFRVLGQAYGTYVQNKLGERRLVVANDYRAYSRGMAFAFIAGVMSTGVEVIDIGMCMTPVLYFAQYHFKCKGGAMVTASHNDNGFCGLKLACGFSETFEPDHIQDFKKLVYSGEFTKGSGSYTREEGVVDVYLQDILQGYKKYKGARKLKVVVAAANGGPGEFLPGLLEQLGFEVIRDHCELDWDFPHFNPNPEDLKFLHDLGDAVREHNADLGVAADGDGDRFGVVDETGHEIFSDRAGLFLARFIADKAVGRTVVIDVKSTGAYQLDPVLKQNKIRVEFSKTGHSYVKAATRKYNAIAGFERSGHFFLRDEFGYGFDDACRASALFCCVVSQSSKKLSELIAEQPKSFQSPTMSPSVRDDKLKYEIVEAIAAEFDQMQKRGATFAGQKIREIISVNGSRVVLEDGSWGLVRASSNLPVLVICIESMGSKKVAYQIFDEINSHLEGHGIKKENYDQLMPPYKE